MPTPPKTASRGNTLRIIGGRWRGRRLAFPDAPGLRPTPDRVRETVFNWLQGWIEGARCLDLFAGSGAFGLEALSRGAAWATLVDTQRAVLAQLGRNLKMLQAEDAAELLQSDARTLLAGRPHGQPYDLVFLDPPYRQGLLAACCGLLERNGWLAHGARIYLEAEAELELTLPPGWELLRSKRTGQVGYHLATCRGSPSNGDNPILETLSS